MEQYNSIQQLLKKEGGQNRKPIFPPTVVQAVFDAKTGASLESILAQFNSVYLQYQGSPKATRLIIPKEMRRAGLTITYMNMEGETITERASSAVQKDNDNWGLDINWSRIDELSLSGDISVSVQGTWIINGIDTGVKAVGPKGEAGITPFFRWYDNKIQISYDNMTWTDLSEKFADNLYIKGYVATTSALPSGAAQGDIYGVGPTYAAEDTARTNPIYRYYVRNANTWVDNGAFTSIAAGIVQETGNSENAVMSQKAVTEKYTELVSKISSVNINANISTSGYFKLDKPIKKGEKCIVKIKLNPWGVYTNFVFYTEQGGLYEDVRSGFYTIDEVFDYVPNIDVNYIRIDGASPNADAFGEVVVYSNKQLAGTEEIERIDKEIESLKYVGDPIRFEGKSGYVNIGQTLYKGRRYAFNYNSKGYNGQLYYFELAINGRGFQDIVTTGGVGQSELKGDIIVVPDEDGNMVRIGVGSSVPDDALTQFCFKEIASYVGESEFSEAIKEIDNKINDNTTSLAPFFVDEMEDTIGKINDLTNQRCLVMPIITDNHWRWTTEEGNKIKDRSINNVKYLNSRVYCDGVVHIGDILDSGVIGDTTDKELHDLMQRYLLQLSTANRHFYAINGNHDGSKLSMFDEMKWYGMIGRATANDNDVHRYMTTPYYYIDHKPTKLRIVCLANPDNVTGVGTTWGFSQRELDWLETEALNVPQDYSVLFITHIPPIKGYVDSAANLESFANLCKTFNGNHTGKVVGIICGHSHVDLLVTTDWTYEGFSNILPCPIVLLGSNYYNLGTEDRLGEFGGIIYGRVPNTATEDLWTVLVYTPDSGTKFNFIRFGAGADVAF